MVVDKVGEGEGEERQKGVGKADERQSTAHRAPQGVTQVDTEGDAHKERAARMCTRTHARTFTYVHIDICTHTGTNTHIHTHTARA